MPPTSIEIVDHPAGSRVKIQENEEVELTCKVANAKPKAVIVWYRKDSQFVTGKIMLIVISISRNGHLKSCARFIIEPSEIRKKQHNFKMSILSVEWCFFKRKC